MRYFIRLMIALLTFVVGLTATAVWSVFQPSAPVARPATRNDSVNVTISPVKFYEWQRDKQLPASIGKDEDEALPSYSYHQIKDWATRDELHSAQIDIVFRLENHGSQPVDLMTLATGDFNLSPLEQMVTGSEERHLTLLTERQNIGQQVIHDLAPGEVREVRFTDCNLKMMANKYLRKEYGTLRPWELKVNVDVMTLDNMQTAWAGGQLRLTLGTETPEARLPGNSSIKDAR
jgi:hypothetical protein